MNGLVRTQTERALRRSLERTKAQRIVRAPTKARIQRWHREGVEGIPPWERPWP